MSRNEFEAWETHAQWWQDGHTDGADPEYVEQIVPIVRTALEGSRVVLDIGAGEGQLARDLTEHGAQVTGLDPSVAQLRTALQRAGGPTYALGAAAALPFADVAFDGVLACLVFEHITEMEAAMAEIGRVLQPGGRFVLILNHPLMQSPDSGWIDDYILEEQYWRIGPYLPVDIREETLDKGVTLPFVHRPTSAYLNAMFANGFVVDGFDEPAPAAGFLERAPEYSDQSAYPRILAITARKER